VKALVPAQVFVPLPYIGLFGISGHNQGRCILASPINVTNNTALAAGIFISQVITMAHDQQDKTLGIYLT